MLEWLKFKCTVCGCETEHSDESCHLQDLMLKSEYGGRVSFERAARDSCSERVQKRCEQCNVQEQWHEKVINVIVLPETELRKLLFYDPPQFWGAASNAKRTE